MLFAPVVVAIPLLLFAADQVELARDEIIAAYRASLDALRRGDPDGALRIDTDDWVSVVAGQKPRSRQELEPYIRRDIATLKPPEGWSAYWKPDYDRNGIGPGIQIYDFKIDGDSATVLALVGNTRRETVDGAERTVWTGSHVRDTWIRTPQGWRRKKHEKLTVNERMFTPATR